MYGGRGLDDGAAGAIIFTVIDDDGRSLKMIDAPGGEPEVLDDGIAYQSLPARSPDGTRVAYVAGRTMDESVLRTVRVADGAIVDVAPAPGGVDVGERPAWSPDGSRIAFVAQQDDDPIESIYVVAAEDGAPQRVGPEPVDRVVCNATEDEIEFFDRPRCRTDLTGGARSVVWTADDELAYVSEVGGSHVESATLVLPLPRDRSGGDRPSSAVWSPDRQHIAYASVQGRLYLMNTDGTGQTSIIDVDGEIGSLHWLGEPDG